MVVKAPGCIDKGISKIVATVTIGDQTYSDGKEIETDAVGHDWKFRQHISLPTQTTAGEDEYVCSRCQDKDVREVEVLDIIVTLNTGDSSEATNKNVKYNAPYGELPVPTKEQRLFVGWFTDEDVQITKDSIVTIGKNHTLYAKWTVYGIPVDVILCAGEGVLFNEHECTCHVTSGKAYGTLPTPNLKGYIFEGWYTSNNQLVTTATVVNNTETHKLYAKYSPLSIDWRAEVEPELYYTGATLIPEVTVTDSNGTLLVENVDYTLSYSNNKSVSTSKTKGKVIIKGKGIYSGTITKTFTILPASLEKSMEDGSLQVADIVLSRTSKTQKAAPTVKFNGKALKKDKDYIVKYPDTTSGAYRYTGTYPIQIIGKGSFTGTITVYETITDDILMSKVSVSGITNKPYTGEAIEQNITIKYGKGKSAVTLVENKDYTVSYENNIEIGTAAVILTAIEGSGYTGTVKKTFSITGKKIASANIAAILKQDYNGLPVCPEITVTYGKNSNKITLVEGVDYEIVSYSNNVTATTKASVKIKGIGAYYGTISKTFQICEHAITAADMEIVVEPSCVIAKGGAKAGVRVCRDGVVLEEGKDYTLSYSKNTTAGKNGTVKISGKKGRYSGSVTKTFAVTSQDIGNLTIRANDIVYSTAANKYMTAVTICDLDNKVLKPGTDYTLTYYVDAEHTIAYKKNDKIVPNAEYIYVVATAKGNYTLICQIKFHALRSQS